MIQFLLIVIFISAALSLLSYLYCWQDIRGGRPHIVSLRQITSMMDRMRLNQWFGSPQPGYYYALSPEQIRGIWRRRASFIVSECCMDGLCMGGAWWYSTNADNSASVIGFVMLGGLSQAINFGYSFWLMRKWQHQIIEEIENSDG